MSFLCARCHTAGCPHLSKSYGPCAGCGGVSECVDCHEEQPATKIATPLESVAERLKAAHLRSLIEQLRPFAKHDPSCPWFGHDYGVKPVGRNYSGWATTMGPVTEPCRCGLGKLDAKIDEAMP